MAGEITVTDLQNAKLDVQTIAEVAMVDYTADSTTNRNGDTIRTLAGQLAQVGYDIPVAYAGSIVFGSTAYTKTIERSGVIYAGNVSDLPFTTTGTWGTDAAKFYVVQQRTIDAADIPYTAPTSGTIAAGDVDGALNELDGDVQTVSTKATNLVTLSGVAANSTSLGTFTGSTIADNSTVKTALQALETKAETVPTLAYGTWTPTVTKGANVASSTARECQYTRVGDIVYFSGRVDVDPTSANASTVISITKPVASNFSSYLQCYGTIVAMEDTTPAYTAATFPGTILANPTDDLIYLCCYPNSSASRNWIFTGSYKVI